MISPKIRLEPEPTIQMIAPCHICFHRQALVREKLYWETIQTYIDALQRGEELPPPDVFHNASEGRTYLASGFHRVIAFDHVDCLETHDGVKHKFVDLYKTYFKKDGEEWGCGRSVTPIKCRVHSGTFQDAVWFALGSNKNHGRPLTNQEKQDAVRTALRHANGKELSDRAIAGLVGVDNKTVATIRKELVAIGELPQLEIRIGRDGKRRKVPKTDKGDTIQVRVAYNRKYCCACYFRNEKDGHCSCNEEKMRPFGSCECWAPGDSLPPEGWEPAPHRIMASSVKPYHPKKPSRLEGAYRVCHLPVENPALAVAAIREILGDTYIREMAKVLDQILTVDVAEAPAARYPSLSGRQKAK